jgi:hypothetical protein
MVGWSKFAVVIFLAIMNVVAVILCFRHYEHNGTVPVSYGHDRYQVGTLLFINYELFFSSILTTGAWSIACMIHDFLFDPEDKVFAAISEGLFRYATLLLLDLRIRMLNETSFSSRLSIAFGDAVAVSLMAVHSYWHRKVKRT